MLPLLIACVVESQDKADSPIVSASVDTATDSNDDTSLVDSGDSVGDSATPCYADADGDGFGDAQAPVDCTSGVVDATDCDDDDPTISPAAFDACGDGVDSDCSGADLRCAPAGPIETDAAEVRLYGAEADDHAGASVAMGQDCAGAGSAGIVVYATQHGHGSEGAGGRFYALSGTGLSDGVLPAGGATLSTPWTDVWEAYGGRQLCTDDVGGEHGGALFLTVRNQDEHVWGVGFAVPVSGEQSVEDATWRIVGDTAFDVIRGFSVGDIDGNGTNELIVAQIGAVQDDSGTHEDMGRAYVLEPSDDPLWSVDDARATLTPYSSADFGWFGYATCVNDLDGDGLSDVVAGMPVVSFEWAVPESIEAGVVFVSLGPLEGNLTMGGPNGALGDADGRWDGERIRDWAGEFLSCGRDVGGDGLPDLVVGAPGWDPGDDLEEEEGAAYLVDGPATGGHSLTEASWVLQGTSAVRDLGFPVTNDSDLDADGLGDIAVGSYDPDYLGHVFLFYGGGLSGTVTPDSADATFNGGPPYDAANQVAGGGDLDGDGFDDLVIGADQDSTNGDLAGAAFIVYGGSRE